jgi:hypothetical protein
MNNPTAITNHRANEGMLRGIAAGKAGAVGSRMMSYAPSPINTAAARSAQLAKLRGRRFPAEAMAMIGTKTLTSNSGANNSPSVAGHVLASDA